MKTHLYKKKTMGIFIFGGMLVSADICLGVADIPDIFWGYVSAAGSKGLMTVFPVKY